VFSRWAVRVRTVGALHCRLAFFACRDVAAGEELTFDYGHGGGGDAPATPTSAVAARRPCHCGAVNCRGFLPFDPLA
jgi:SET domain-containing protein